ncbi:thiamine diphosphokinase [uncultured Helcococcus sp.]|uniref:thiamine diphosphokinase n=1 Tax=uncultured Helcococcus sp. TaxID=1072508 RepID=UPI002612D770|nr:thiamine diphosphokinase [uncultured Helcococcus sp.]
MVNTLIVSGGSGPGKDFLEKYYKQADKVIAVDKGLNYLSKYGFEADYIIGDFDSVDLDILSGADQDKLIKYPAEKAMTDFEIALEKAIELKSDNIYLLSAMGDRMDHTMANILLLKRLAALDIRGYILDENNLISYVDGELEVDKNDYKYLSIIVLEDTLVTLKGVKYTLDKEKVSFPSSLTISNEIIGDKAYIETDKFSVFMLTDHK